VYSLVRYFSRGCINQTKQQRECACESCGHVRCLSFGAVSAHGPGVCLRWSVKGRAQINAPVAGSAPQFSLNSSTLPAPALAFALSAGNRWLRGNCFTRALGQTIISRESNKQTPACRKATLMELKLYSAESRRLRQQSAIANQWRDAPRRALAPCRRTLFWNVSVLTGALDSTCARCMGEITKACCAGDKGVNKVSNFCTPFLWAQAYYNASCANLLLVKT
jgi:hypothetical protein